MKHAGGRPTKYKPEYAEQAYKLCLLSATDDDLADFFEVNVDTINQWKKNYLEFSDSLKRGKIEADTNVSKSLYHRAIGYEHEDVDIKMYKDRIIQTKIIKHYPPDPTSMIFWLKNRQRGKWTEKIEVDQNIRGDVNIKVSTYAIHDPLQLQSGKAKPASDPRLISSGQISGHQLAPEGSEDDTRDQ